MGQNPSTFGTTHNFVTDVVDGLFLCVAQGTIPKTIKQGITPFIWQNFDATLGTKWQQNYAFWVLDLARFDPLAIGSVQKVTHNVFAELMEYEGKNGGNVQSPTFVKCHTKPKTVPGLFHKRDTFFSRTHYHRRISNSPIGKV